MNNFKKATLSLALVAAGFAAQAQKSFTEGVIVYSVTTNGQQNEAKNYFKGDSSAYVLQQGPADIKIISNDKADYRAILVDVPVASIKKAAVLTPADMEQMKTMEPTFTSTPTTETQTIAGYKCTKVTAKDAKSGKTYDVWVTNDITAPTNSLTKYYANFGGMPVKFSISQMGQQVDVVLKSITAEKVKPGTFAVPADFDKITMQDLMSMRGGN
ncbi:MAG: DUF4412 domain-containing protein [Sphingobacteriaceae bacterium]|nr:MAG: DUF4412 domain-containing protein [Sphingobacteriaceae bacterium]